LEEHSHQFNFELHKEKEMADFRKLLLALIAGALLFTTVASAAPYSCNATAVPTLARSEGIAEMMGDVLLTCDGTVPSGGILANIRLRLTANITSRLLSSSTSEATLVLDEGLTAAGKQFHGGTPGDGSQNIYQAKRISDDEIEWEGVWLAGEGSNPFKTIRLTNVRGNVQSRGDFATIYASINIVSPTSVPVDNNLLVVADTRPGLSFSVESASFKNCEAPEEDIWLSFQEGFASAFKPVGNAASTNTVPGGGYLNESGFNPGPAYDSEDATMGFVGSLTSASSIGQATQGTRLMARFKNVPSGVTLTADGVIDAGGMELRVVKDMDTSGAGGSMSTSGYTIGSNGLLVYEVYSIDASSYSTRETVEIPVHVSYSIPGPLGSGTVNGNFAPISTTYVMSQTAKVPRFVDRAVDSTAIEIGPCRTILLFPYVTNQASFDTGIAIANTSKDPLGTTNQAGACTLYYYGNTNGSTGPANQTTPSVPAGGHFVMSVALGGGVFGYNAGFTACASGNCVAPLFEGYVFAICNFQFAHGFAYVNDNGPSHLGAMGYLALIIPDRGIESGARLPVDSSLDAGANQGENVGN